MARFWLPLTNSNSLSPCFERRVLSSTCRKCTRTLQAFKTTERLKKMLRTFMSMSKNETESNLKPYGTCFLVRENGRFGLKLLKRTMRTSVRELFPGRATCNDPSSLWPKHWKHKYDKAAVTARLLART